MHGREDGCPRQREEQAYRGQTEQSTARRLQAQGGWDEGEGGAEAGTDMQPRAFRASL